VQIGRRILNWRAIDAVIFDSRTDELMSTYKPESQLSQVNAHAYERPVQVDADIIDVVEKALEYSRLSDGAFDITYASVGYLYDYRAHTHPSDAQIDSALKAVDYRQLSVDREARTIRFLRPGMRIDLGGIAKGWSVDRGVEILERLGIEHAMVNAGGDRLLMTGAASRIVGIRDPHKEGTVVARIPLRTKLDPGDYERYFEDGVRYHPSRARHGRSPGGAQRDHHRADATHRTVLKPVHTRRRARHGVRAARRRRRSRDR
jgi:thiamine biosynthesis lipoprotein